MEICRHKKGCRDKDMEAASDTLAIRTSKEKGRRLKDTL